MAVHIDQGSGKHMLRHAWRAARLAISAKYAEVRKGRVVNEVEQEAIQENIGEDFEMVSINSVYFTKNCSVLMAYLKTLVGKNSMSIPYKIDTRSDGNIMAWHIFKKLLPGVTNVQLAETINIHIMLKTYKQNNYNPVRHMQSNNRT